MPTATLFLICSGSRGCPWRRSAPPPAWPIQPIWPRPRMLHFLPLLGRQDGAKFQRELRNRPGRFRAGRSQAIDRVIRLGLIHRLFVERSGEIGICFVHGLLHFPHPRTKISADLQNLFLLGLAEIRVLGKIAIPPRPRPASTGLPVGSSGSPGGQISGLTRRLTCRLGCR
jgi:hypothetical protein